MFDQFEEFFIATPERERRAAFGAALATCCEDAALPLRFLISVRGDFFTDLADFQPSLPHIFYNEYRLVAMSRDEARQAIQQPLRWVQPPCHMSPDLLHSLLDDLESTGMELPHLQIICTRLYETRQPNESSIELNHYQALGGAAEILGSYLRQSVAQLGAAAPLARAVLLELGGTEQHRQSRSLLRLREQLIQRDDLAQLELVLAALVTARLVQRDNREGVAHYELAHDYLLREIQTWITPEDLSARRARETLQRGLAGWRDLGSPLDLAAFQFIHRQRRGLSGLSITELELLLRSAVHHQFAVEAWAPAAQRAGIDIWPILQPLIESASFHSRAGVISILPLVGSTALPALQNALNDPIPLVRGRALQALTELATPEAHQILQHSPYRSLIYPGGSDECATSRR